MKLNALAAALILGWAKLASAQTADAPKPPQFKFEFHGFTSGTLTVQDASTAPGSGGSGMYAIPNGNTADPGNHRLSFGGDVRQTRFQMSLAGPQVFGGATPKAGIEIDFLGGNAAGGFGDVHLLPRMRLGYAELNWGANRLVFGQYIDLSAVFGANSLSHLGTPITLAAGNAGFRRPGIFGYHTFVGDVAKKSDAKVEFAWEVGRSEWNDTGSGGGAPASGVGASECVMAPAGTPTPGPNICPGEASGLPAVQARLSYAQGDNQLMVAGHWNRVHRLGSNNTQNDATPIGLRDLDVVGAIAGFRLVGGPLTLVANGFVGKNLGPLYGTVFPQFTAAGDIHELGGFVNLGLNFTNELSLWGFIGADKPNLADARAGGIARLKNVTGQAQLQYREGGYAIGLEWARYLTSYASSANPAGAAAGEFVIAANQIALSGVYFF